MVIYSRQLVAMIEFGYSGALGFAGPGFFGLRHRYCEIDPGG
jgi:hypothetical protein